MKPVDFPESQVVFAKDQPEYQSLPAHISDDGIVTSCWELTEAEIEEIVRTKRLWLRSLTFFARLQPLLPQVESPFVGPEQAPPAGQVPPL